MPLPMVHLAVAVQAHALAGQPLTPAFLSGSLAPDAIHMRANSNREDKNKVHLLLSDSSEAELLERLQVLMDQNRVGKNENSPFAAGYAAHLLTDYWWLQAVGRPFFTEQLPPDLSPEERRAWYYRETDQVDFNLYHQAPWRKAVWDLLAAASAPEFAPYLTAEEIDRWRLRTLDWFEKLKLEPGIVPQIITDRVVEDFIEETAKRIQPILFPKEGERAAREKDGAKPGKAS